MTKPTRFRVQRQTTEYVDVQAISSDDALRKAKDLERSDWLIGDIRNVIAVGLLSAPADQTTGAPASGYARASYQALLDAFDKFEAADKQYKSWEIIIDEEPIRLRDRRPLDLIGADKHREWMARDNAITALIEAVRQFVKESRE